MSDKKDEEIIRRIAYRIYQQRMRLNLPGDALSDWLQAKEETKRLKEQQKGSLR